MNEIEAVKATGLEYQAYPQTMLLNVTDVDGVIQSYYCSTRTAIFRDGNNKYKSKKHTERDMPFERFLSLCNGEEDILTTFFNEEE